MSDEPAPAPKHPGGRPTDYDPAYCERVIELGRDGKGRAEIASDLECSRQTLANWEATHPEFLDAMRRANDESLAWWEAKARKGIDNREFNAVLWGKSMGGRFPAEPYRERVQLTGKDDGPIRHQHDLSGLSDEELEQLERIRTKLGASEPGGDQGGEGEAGG